MSFETYLTKSVWLIDPRDQIQEGHESYARTSGEAWTPREFFSFGPSNVTLSFPILMRTLDEQWEVEEHFRTVKGKEGMFWLPSFVGVIKAAADANAAAASIEIQDTLEEFGLKGIKRHIWLPDVKEGYEISNPVGNVSNNIDVDISPVLASNIKEGDELWGLYLMHFAIDRLRIESTDLYYTDVDGTRYNVKRAQLEFTESQSETPTAF